MKGIVGLGNFMLNVNQTSQKNTKSNESVSFGQFMQQYRGQRVTTTDTKVALGQDEQNLLEKSMLHLVNFKLELQKLSKISGDISDDQLKKVLEKMVKDIDFVNALTPDLKATLQRLLQQMKEGKVERTGFDELAQIWNMHQEKKRQKMMAEVDELISAIQERLALAGINTKVLIVDKDGEKSARVSFQRDDSAFAKNLSKGSEGQKVEQDGQSSVLSKQLLNRISNFLSGTDGTSEKSELNKLTVELREELKHFLRKEAQPVGWRKEELIHKAQYGALQEMGDQELAGLVDGAIAPEAVEELIKEGAKELVNSKGLLQGEEEVLVQNLAENEGFATLLNQMESNAREARQMVETVVRSERMYQPQADDLFQQMVERFRLDVKQGVSEMQIRLHPEELGVMHLKLTVEKGIVTAQFLTESVRVKELIEQNIAQLRDTFAKDGIHWDQITVDVGQEGLRDNPFASQQQQGARDQRQANTKRQRFADTMADEMEIDEVLSGSDGPKDPNRIVDYRA